MCVRTFHADAEGASVPVQLLPVSSSTTALQQGLKEAGGVKATTTQVWGWLPKGGRGLRGARGVGGMQVTCFVCQVAQQAVTMCGSCIALCSLGGGVPVSAAARTHASR